MSSYPEGDADRPYHLGVAGESGSAPAFAVFGGVVGDIVGLARLERIEGAAVSGSLTLFISLLVTGLWIRAAVRGS